MSLGGIYNGLQVKLGWLNRSLSALKRTLKQESQGVLSLRMSINDLIP